MAEHFRGSSQLEPTDIDFQDQTQSGIPKRAPYRSLKVEALSILYRFLDDVRVVLCQLCRIISLVSCERLNSESGLDHGRSVHV